MLLKFTRFLIANNVKPTYISSFTPFTRLKSTDALDYSRYPKLIESELEETFTRGSGPGGQAVNKTSNCVLLRHIPTNILVKCHTHRIAYRNRAEARKILLEKLDNHFNGEHSIAAQIKLLESKKSADKKRRQVKVAEMKKNWKEREAAVKEENDT
ncbi:probable peptide chain release factor C12orf65, mitochondrial [Teleopsis dalmanni]|uniref:probable peptide chain release factor C12orf65, mitochondrial n=1 Tax=Teleopsis dalmanni TaxID=139649 RepID=UPI0018CEB253|nr:probable peptide chain release factor C12orf65, mitochondrial [Teleopsis dalmanni]